MGARVHLCGRLQVEWDGERLEDALRGRQGRLLFAFLTLHRERPVRRDELVEALWSEAGPPPGGDALLRPPLSRLRTALGPGRLEGRAELAVRFPGDTWIDREAVRDGLRAGRAAYAAGDARGSWEAAREALAIAERGLLPGLEARWLEPFRAELEEQRVELLETVALAGARLGDGELPEAEQAARRAVEAAPFRESARAALLEVLRRRGNVAEALVAYEEFRTFLRDELGTAPGRELLALHEDLLRAGPPRRHPVPSAARAQRLPDRLAQALAAPWVGREAALAAAARAGGPGGRGEQRARARGRRGRHRQDAARRRAGRGPRRLRRALRALRRGGDLSRTARGSTCCGRGSTAWARPSSPRCSGPRRTTSRGSCPSSGSACRAPTGRRPGDPETERRLLFVAVTRVVGRLARQRPLLLVLDDLHWADRSSLLLARHLAREPRLGRCSWWARSATPSSSPGTRCPS